MFLKLAIIGVILLAGGIIFSSQIQEIFPNTSSTGVNSLKSDINIISTKSIESAGEEIKSSVKQTENKLSEIGRETIKNAGDALEQTEDKFSEIKEDSTEYVKEGITKKIPFLNSDG